jgi:hypothetical protein
MNSLGDIFDENRKATLREFQEAVADGNLALAERIAAANPDLFSPDVRRDTHDVPRG